MGGRHVTQTAVASSEPLAALLYKCLAATRTCRAGLTRRCTISHTLQAPSAAGAPGREAAHAGWQEQLPDGARGDDKHQPR